MCERFEPERTDICDQCQRTAKVCDYYDRDGQEWRYCRACFPTGTFKRKAQPAKRYVRDYLKRNPELETVFPDAHHLYDRIFYDRLVGEYYDRYTDLPLTLNDAKAFGLGT